VVALNDAIPDLTKEIGSGFIFRGIAKFLSSYLDFILEFLQFTGTLIAGVLSSFQLAVLYNEIRPKCFAFVFQFNYFSV
jgi:hypothetical protein